MRKRIAGLVVVTLTGCAAIPWEEPSVRDFSEDRVQVGAKGPGAVPDHIRGAARRIAAQVCEREYKRHIGTAYEGTGVTYVNDPFWGPIQVTEWTAVYPCRAEE